MASKAPMGVVFRRGPANAVCTIGWNRKTDEFQLGQWLRGRIYERRADISPNGKHLIYFARGGRGYPEAKGSWTAISRTPWLKAVSVWGKGDTWQGGGLFISDQTYWLNGCHFPLHNSPELRVDERYRPMTGFGAECLSVYFPRLLRDGWAIEAEIGPHRACVIFVKQLPHGWILRKFAYADVQHPQGAGCYWDEHEIEHSKSKALFECKSWEWADRDGDTIVWAEKGAMHRAGVGRDGPRNQRILKDFNDLEFERIEAPY